MKNCELCKGPARSYCESDQASLCWNCDAKVHGANFLVARHIRTVLCHVCQSLTPWKASGADLGVTVSACENCVVGVRNRDGDEDNKRDVDYYEFEAEDDDYDDEDEELSGDDEDDNNQVVPWSSSLTLPPPAVSSSGNEESINWFSNGGVSRKVSVFPSKRMSEKASDLRFEDVFCSSSHGRRYSLESKSKAHLAGTDGEQNCVDNSRPLKDRRTGMDRTVQCQPVARCDNLLESLRKLHSRDTRQLYDQYGTGQCECSSESPNRPMTPI